MQAAQGQGGHKPAGTIKPLPHPLLHIGAEQQVGGRPGLELAGAQPQLGRAAPEQNDPAHARTQQALQGGVVELPAGVAALAIGEVAAAADHHQAGHQAGQGVVEARGGSFPLTGPLTGLFPDPVHAVVVPVGTMQAQPGPGDAACQDRPASTASPGSEASSMPGPSAGGAPGSFPTAVSLAGAASDS